MLSAAAFCAADCTAATDVPATEATRAVSLVACTVTRYTFTIWPTLLPSLMIFLTVLAFNTFGESLRSALDPQSVT